MQVQRLKAWFGIALLATGLVVVLPPEPVGAVPTLVQSANTVSNNSNVLNLSFPANATANNLLIIVCSKDTATISVTPTAGFSTAITQNGTPSQSIFYKIAVGGENNFSCTYNNAGFVGMHIYEYNDIDTANPLLNAGSAAGTSNAVSSGSITTTVPDALLFSASVISANTSFVAYTNSFTEIADFNTGSGNPGSRKTYGAAHRTVTSTGTYSTVATAGSSGAWRGQIVAFREALVNPVLSVDIVDASGVSVASPSATLSTATAGFNCQTVTGTIGTSAQRIRVTNTTTSPAWTVAIAATSGATALWNSGGNNYDFNDPNGAPAGCGDGGDADTRPGQLTLNPSIGTTSPQSGCTTTGVTRGSSAGYNQGITNSLTLISASGSAQTGCYWDLTGISASQTIPATQPAGTYTLNLTITIVAN